MLNNHKVVNDEMNYVCWWNQHTNKLVKDDPKLLDDSGKVPKPNRVVGGLNPRCEIVSLLDKKLAMWSSTSWGMGHLKNMWA